MSYKTGASSQPKAESSSIMDPSSVVEAMEKHLPPKWLGHNQPPVQEQLDDLREQVKSMREALSCVMAAMLPAFGALERLEGCCST